MTTDVERAATEEIETELERLVNRDARMEALRHRENLHSLMRWMETKGMPTRAVRRLLNRIAGRT